MGSWLRLNEEYFTTDHFEKEGVCIKLVCCMRYTALSKSVESVDESVRVGDVLSVGRWGISEQTYG